MVGSQQDAAAPKIVCYWIATPKSTTRCCIPATLYTLDRLKLAIIRPTVGEGVMRKILLASVAALGLAGTAAAADLPVAPVVYAPVFTWTGCYLGVNGGWIGSDESFTSYSPAFGHPVPVNGAGFTPAQVQAATTRSWSSDESAGTAGGQFGCQAQFGSWVIGGEWDWNWSGLEDDYSAVTAAGNPFTFPWAQYTHKELDWFSTARAKLGFAWDRFMIYATGGLAYGAFDAYTHVDSLPGALAGPEWTGAYREKLFGWTVGGGFEWAFANNWTAKAEFLYLDFGSFDYVSPRPGSLQTWYTDVEAKQYVARVGINYLFHTGGAPLVARY
ncbi:MAG: outer membrane beta-barrel protein [Xanthobacteraceae bacterium]